MLTIVVSLLVVGWVAAALLGTQAYFLGEQTKPIHERNWRSTSFEALSETITGRAIDHNSRVPAAYGKLDAYNSSLLPNS